MHGMVTLTVLVVGMQPFFRNLVLKIHSSFVMIMFGCFSGLSDYTFFFMIQWSVLLELFLQPRKCMLYTFDLTCMCFD